MPKAYKRARRTISGLPSLSSFSESKKKDMSPSELRKIIRKELNNEIEEKHGICEYQNIAIQRNIPSGVVFNADEIGSTGNFYKILPEISQSVTGETGRAYNTRIGNEITLKEIDLHGFLSHADDVTNDISLPNSRLAVRVMILRAKEVNDGKLLFDNMPTDTLLRFGNWDATGNAGPSNFGGFVLDPFRDINRDTFSVRFDETYQIEAPVLIGGASSVTAGVIPSTTKFFRHKLKFGANGLKLKYSQESDLEPNNFPYFLCVGYSSTTGTSGPENDKVRMTLSCVGTYTDA